MIQKFILVQGPRKRIMIACIGIIISMVPIVIGWSYIIEVCFPITISKHTAAIIIGLSSSRIDTHEYLT